MNEVEELIKTVENLILQNESLIETLKELMEIEEAKERGDYE